MGSMCGLWALSLSNRTPTFFTYLIEFTLSDVSVSRNCAALTTCGFKGQPYRFKPLTPLPMTAPPCHHPQTLPPVLHHLQLPRHNPHLPSSPDWLPHVGSVPISFCGRSFYLWDTRQLIQGSWFWGKCRYVINAGNQVVQAAVIQLYISFLLTRFFNPTSMYNTEIGTGNRHKKLTIGKHKGGNRITP